MNSSVSGVIGGLEMTAPLDVEDERALYPIIQLGRDAAATLDEGDVRDVRERRRLARLRHDGQEAEATLLRATLGLVRTRVVERGYRFGNDELEAAGVEALVNALHRFDPTKGARFSTYANYWIMKLVNQAIQQQAGLSDAEMRQILKVRKLERSATTGAVGAADVAAALGISVAKAAEVIQLGRELQARRFEATDQIDATYVKPAGEPIDAPAWVIDALHRLCGDDFDAFWQYTFRTMSLDELAKSYGISRQGMSKRIDRCRKAVRESPEAQQLLAWFGEQ
jgi:RNA polymerase sigma factor (sigma-70 family)